VAHNYNVPYCFPVVMCRAVLCCAVLCCADLQDVLEQQVYQLVPPDLAQACEALAARGGPASPPTGKGFAFAAVPVLG
jgi:hypothetical protein